MRKNPNFGFRMIHAGKMELLAEGMPSLTAEASDIVYAPRKPDLPSAQLRRYSLVLLSHPDQSDIC